ncbi:ORF47 [Xestia c-nigrum granulovirus]|uniref:ORF47 n=1 Tax=Xestia c-nigrum granulosis virus TaxID=51677 RepID=Q9PYZ6_GVXN|nr:ORF47 [Xestia c-nigrum granulovirus]AAF05161.1 ORF47 [Xestia c-nigrum granulovirus]
MNRSIANWIKERNVCVDKEQRLRNLILVYGNYSNADIQNIDTETLLTRVLKKINDQTIEYRSGGDISTTITKDYKNYVVTDELGNFTLVNNNPPPAKRPTLESLKLLLNNKPAYGNPETVRNYLNQVTRLLAELDSRTAPVQTELSLIAMYYGSAASVSVNLDDVTRERDKLLLQIEKCTKDSDRLLRELNEVKFKNGDLQAKCAVYKVHWTMPCRNPAQ